MEGRRGAGPQLQPDTASCAHIFRDQRTVITVTSLPWFVAAGSPGTLRLPPGVVILGYAEVRARSISGAAHAAQGGVIAQAATSGEAGQVPEAHGLMAFLDDLRRATNPSEPLQQGTSTSSQ